jgi:transcriptional regulator with XRE-family HTH domain
MTIHWNVSLIRRHMAKRGWTNARQLALGTGLTYPTARRILLDEPLERIDVRPLAQLAKALRASPLTLLRVR